MLYEEEQIKSIEELTDKASIKRMAYSFNIKQFFNTDVVGNALGVLILTPYEALFAGDKMHEGIHHKIFLDQIVKIIGKERFKNAIVVRCYSYEEYHDIRFTSKFEMIKTTEITEKMKQTAEKLREIVDIIRNNNEKESEWWYGNNIDDMINANKIDVIKDKDVISEDEKKKCYGVPLKMFYNNLISKENELKGKDNGNIHNR